MSAKHPVVAVTGSSGAGTTTVRRVFERVFVQEGINAAFVEGSAFRRYNSVQTRRLMHGASTNGARISEFGPELNLFDRLEALFREYSRTGTGLYRQYIDSEEDAVLFDQPVGTFTTWTEIPAESDLLFYEGMHGGCIEQTWTRRPMSPSHNPIVVRERQRLKRRRDIGVDVAQWVDLLIGIAPSVNLEWIQKIHSDHAVKGYSAEAVTNTIMQRLPDYLRYITPQFSLTDINFQRVPLVDTSNPFIAREVPTLDESMLVIRFREPERFDLPYFLRRIHNSFMSRPNTMVVPGGEMEHVMGVICTPTIHELLGRLREPESG
ncbi:MAG: phosphoribulokinase [Pseudomonadota bacterium]|nr:MAG: phosphoribulokinase [Pseudomonadota bacterium]